MSKTTRANISILLLSLFVCFYLDASGQNQKDSTLQEFKVKSQHKVSNDTRLNDFSSGQKIRSIDSTTLQQYQIQSLANLLTQQVPVFVKSYGFNGLATLNFRGSSAAQSAVLWNGVPIQNAALGIADVSALPVSFMSKVNIAYGGSSAMWGSGNVGGALLLENDLPVFGATKYRIAAEAGTGSFNQYLGSVNGSWNNNRWFLSGNVFIQRAENNFRYTTLAGKAAKMPNSKLQTSAIMLRAAYKTGQNSTLSLTAWYQQYNREIPPVLPEAYSVKRQKDASLRLLSEWSIAAGQSKWYAKSSLIKDAVDYSDSSILLHNYNEVFQYYQEAGWRFETKRFGRFLLFTPLQIAWLAGNAGTGNPQQTKAAVAGAYNLKLLDDKLDISANARLESIFKKEMSTSANSILLPGISLSYQLWDWLHLRANVQRTYRTPTLNELYYFPGGNSSLKPEQGWSGDAGYAVKLNAGEFSLFHDVAVFDRKIKDWILWIGGAIWTPHNIANVHSRGVETENTASYTIGKWKLHLGINTAYVLATTSSSYIYNDGSIGKQIPYTPRYNGQGNIGFTFRNWYVNYNQTYTGYRFTTSDESYFLLPYNTGNLQLMYGTHINHLYLKLKAQCNNIWNNQYQIVAYRAMPGTNWLFGISTSLASKAN